MYIVYIIRCTVGDGTPMKHPLGGFEHRGMIQFTIMVGRQQRQVAADNTVVVTGRKVTRLWKVAFLGLGGY